MPPRPKKKIGRATMNDGDHGWQTSGGESSLRSSFEEEGVLYTVCIAERRSVPKQSKWDKITRTIANAPKAVTKLASSTKNKADVDNGDNDMSNAENNGNTENNEKEDNTYTIDGARHDQFDNTVPQAPRRTTRRTARFTMEKNTFLARSLVGELVMTPSVRNLITEGLETNGGQHRLGDSLHSDSGDMATVQRQFTIHKKKKKPYGALTYPIAVVSNLLGLDIGRELQQDVDSHRYEPSKFLSWYICWTFCSGFLAVFLSFLVIFIVLCLVFAAFLLVAGNRAPECIVVSGEEFGVHPNTKFNDVVVLSWTTFTTVGYGNVYTATGVDFESGPRGKCSWVVFLCTLEAFTGVLYAGMCAAILFGKVNRVQCHANVKFCNAVCLLYSYKHGKENKKVDNYRLDSDEDMFPIEEEKDAMMSFIARNEEVPAVRCPVLKFQVVNEYCNKEGGDIVDALMKVVGVKVKTQEEGRITHSQYVRVNLVDSEHPFFSRVWHVVHVLDQTSQLLTHDARNKIKRNGGVWPKHWFRDPEKIRSKLDFQSLILTISGTSNLSACTVHAYKRYSSGDLLVGFDFAPLVFFNEKKNSLEVDMGLVHDVEEQAYGTGENIKKVELQRASTIVKPRFNRAQSC